MNCSSCKQDVLKITFRYSDLDNGYCKDCFYMSGDPSPNVAPGVITDSIPGGLAIKHGLCNPDGSPRRFDSKSDIKRAAFEAGWTIAGETPKVNQRLREARLAREGL